MAFYLRGYGNVDNHKVEIRAFKSYITVASKATIRWNGTLVSMREKVPIFKMIWHKLNVLPWNFSFQLCFQWKLHNQFCFSQETFFWHWNVCALNTKQMPPWKTIVASGGARNSNDWHGHQLYEMYFVPCMYHAYLIIGRNPYIVKKYLVKTPILRQKKMKNKFNIFLPTKTWKKHKK